MYSKKTLQISPYTSVTAEVHLPLTLVTFSKTPFEQDELTLALSCPESQNFSAQLPGLLAQAQVMKAQADCEAAIGQPPTPKKSRGKGGKKCRWWTDGHHHHA